MVVLDFGIARLEARDTRVTDEGAFFGTPAYLPPEWIQKQVAGPAMDVYQMGLILAECLAGVPAVEADSPYECLTRHVDGELAIPTAVLEGPLGGLISRAVARDVEQRFANGGEFFRALLDTIEQMHLQIEGSWMSRSWDSLPNIAALVEAQKRPSLSLTSAPSLVLDEPSSVLPRSERPRVWPVAVGVVLVVVAMVGAAWLWIGDADDTESRAHAARADTAEATPAEPEAAPVHQPTAAPQPASPVVVPRSVSTHVIFAGTEKSVAGATLGVVGRPSNDDQARKRKERRREKRSTAKKRGDNRPAMTILP